MKVTLIVFGLLLILTAPLAAEAFHRLGDRDMADLAIRIAERLASAGPSTDREQMARLDAAE